MRLYFLVALSLFSSFSFSSEEDWGQTGHRVTGKIAEQYLSRGAKRKIEKILDGQSLAFVSTFGDDIKSDPRFRKYDPWHYVNLEEGETEYSEEKANPEGDLVMAIRESIEVLEDENASKEDKRFFLKLLVHFVGDLHQPLHSGRGSDRGGNDIEVEWFSDETNLHRVWDSEMIDSFQMSYSELAINAEDLSRRQIKAIASGSILDWMYESKELSNEVYASVEDGDELGYRYMYDWFPVVRKQLHKGGIRLAHILNRIY